MAEKKYIERKKAQDGLDNIDWYHVNDKGQLLPGGKSDIETYVPFKAVEEMLKSIPAADVRPVVRARWIHVPSDGKFRDTCVCSACKKSPPIESWVAQGFNACPYCFADMREES